MLSERNYLKDSSIKKRQIDRKEPFRLFLLAGFALRFPGGVVHSSWNAPQKYPVKVSTLCGRLVRAESFLSVGEQDEEEKEEEGKDEEEEEKEKEADEGEKRR
jgi:hypothetical protein